MRFGIGQAVPRSEDPRFLAGRGRYVADIDLPHQAYAAFIYAPLLEDKPRLIQETNCGHQGREVAERVHQRLREAGGVTPPREFVFMDRAAIGLGSVFFHLKAEINWYRLFHELIADFEVDALARRQAAALKACGLPSP